jgi:hypothetical protein
MPKLNSSRKPKPKRSSKAGVRPFLAKRKKMRYSSRRYKVRRSLPDYRPIAEGNGRTNTQQKRKALLNVVRGAQQITPDMSDSMKLYLKENRIVLEDTIFTWQDIMKKFYQENPRQKIERWVDAALQGDTAAVANLQTLVTPFEASFPQDAARWFGLICAKIWLQDPTMKDKSTAYERFIVRANMYIDYLISNVSQEWCSDMLNKIARWLPIGIAVHGMADIAAAFQDNEWGLPDPAALTRGAIKFGVGVGANKLFN